MVWKCWWLLHISFLSRNVFLLLVLLRMSGFPSLLEMFFPLLVFDIMNLWLCVHASPELSLARVFKLSNMAKVPILDNCKGCNHVWHFPFSGHIMNVCLCVCESGTMLGLLTLISCQQASKTKWQTQQSIFVSLSHSSWTTTRTLHVAPKFSCANKPKQALFLSKLWYSKTISKSVILIIRMSKSHIRGV